MTKDELIEKLPSDLKPWAEIWLPVLLRWSEAEIVWFIANATGYSWIVAYEKMVSAMTTDEKVAELKKRKDELKRLNGDNTLFLAEQRALLFSLLAQAIKALG